jgi:hypothetical protein
MRGCLSFGGFRFVADEPFWVADGEVGWFWHSNMGTIAHRGWFTKNTFLSKLGFDWYDVATTGRGGTWTDWGLVLSDWFLVVLFLILPAMWVKGLRRSLKSGYCATCGYDLRASKDRCPECGTPIPINPETKA